MAARTSTLETTSAYFRRGFRTAFEMAVFLPILCIFTLVPLVSTSEIYGPYAFATYLGMVAFLAASDGRSESPRIKDLDEPKYMKTALSIVLLLYLNALVIFGTAFGYAVESAGFGTWAVIVAALIPALDSTLSRLGMPSLGLIGRSIITIVALVAYLIDLVTPDSSLREEMNEMRNQITDLDSLYEELFARVDAGFSLWA